jgi:STE24 endopeptidase
MQTFVLVLIVALVVHDSGLWHESAGSAAASFSVHWSAASMLTLVLLPKAILLAIYALQARRTSTLLNTAQRERAMRRLDRLSSLVRSGTLALYMMDLFVLDWLGFVRSWVGDRVLIDEVLTLLPSLTVAAGLWWLYEPVDRALRFGAITAHPRTRAGYVLSQARLHVALPLLPMLAVLGWSEGVRAFAAGPGGRWTGLSGAGVAVLSLVGSMSVLLLSPLMLRHVWDTVELDSGELRDRLVAMCQLHRVRVRRVLKWRTGWNMANAGVMGVIAPVRYVLLTDALLETMPPRQIEAVMAHELAHVKRGHMIWLLVAALAELAAAEALWRWVMEFSIDTLRSEALLPAWADVPARQDVALAVLALSTWAMCFGWASRRFERQADTFAVQHLSRQIARAGGMDDQRTIITPDATDAMVNALQTVADLNGIPTNRRSWRHGSIAWRQKYLRSLVGQGVSSQRIDRIMPWIHVAHLVMLVCVLA